MAEYYTFCESRIISDSLKDNKGTYLFQRMCSVRNDKMLDLWFAFYFNTSNIMVSMYIFDDTKEFNRFYNKIKKHYKYENTDTRPDVYSYFQQGDHVTF